LWFDTSETLLWLPRFWIISLRSKPACSMRNLIALSLNNPGFHHTFSASILS
jgi:hypothetical protein